MADILRFRKFLADVASGDDWEYGDGEPMAEDAREFLRKADEVCAERDAAREALGKADKMNEVLNASTSGHFWADIADAQEEYIAARALAQKGE